MLISVQQEMFIYIGQTICLCDIILSHNSGYESYVTYPLYLHLFSIMAYICGFGGRGFLREKLNTCGRSEDTSSLLMVLMTPYNGPDAASMYLTKLMKKILASKKLTYPWYSFFVTNKPIENCSEMSPLQNLCQPAFPFMLTSWITSY